MRRKRESLWSECGQWVDRLHVRGLVGWIERAGLIDWSGWLLLGLRSDGRGGECVRVVCGMKQQ